MNLPSKIQFADEKVKEAVEELKKYDKDEKGLYRYLSDAFREIEENAFCGIQIPKRLIPKEYAQKYKVHNLWKYNLPDAWRLLYSVENQEIVVVSIVLEWMDHKTYKKKFKY